MNNETYIVPEWDEFSRTWKLVAIVLAILLLLLWLLGFGPGGRHCDQGTPVAAADPAECAADATGASQAGSEEDFLNYTVPAYDFLDDATAERLYFAVSSYELPDNAGTVLNSVIENLNATADSVAVISGFHDASGDLTFNQRLAKNRAMAVRDQLVALGANPEKLVLEKPFSSTGSGSAEEARRVEVRLAQLTE